MSQEISAEELQQWAEFVCYHFGAYIIDNPNDDDEIINYYETMGHVVQMLSTLMLDGEITPETVLLYMSELD